MRKLFRRMVRPVASVVMLVGAVLSSAECLTMAQKTPEQHACCVAMKGHCDQATSISCCPSEAPEQGFVPGKQTAPAVPVADLVAVLSVPPVAAPVGHVAAAADGSASGPPGVPTYLFVASFRI